MKAVNDSSTIDFAYIPDFDPDTEENPVFIGVPRIDSSALRSRTGGVGAAEEIEDAVCFRSPRVTGMQELDPD